MSKSLYCIRHGIAEHNMNYLKYGSSTFYDPQYVDTSLVVEGFKQARQLGETWEDINTIELVIVSPLKVVFKRLVRYLKMTSSNDSFRICS